MLTALFFKISMQSVLVEASIESEEVLQLKQNIKRLEKRIEALEEEKLAAAAELLNNGNNRSNNDDESITSIHSNNSHSIQSVLSQSLNDHLPISNFNPLPTPTNPYSNSNSSFDSSSSTYPNTFETPYHQYSREHYPSQDNYNLPTPISPTYSTLPTPLPPPAIAYSDLNERLFDTTPPLPLLPPVPVLLTYTPAQLSYSPAPITSRNLATPYFYQPNRQPQPQSQSISNSLNFYPSNNHFDNPIPTILSPNSSSTYSSNPLPPSSSSYVESIPFPSIGKGYDFNSSTTELGESFNGEGLSIQERKDSGRGRGGGATGRRMSSEGWDEVWKVGARLNEITAETDESYDKRSGGRRM